MANVKSAIESDTNGGFKLTSASNQTYYIDSLDLTNPLGKGGFGIVFKAKNSKGELKAIKKADKSLFPYDKIVMEYKFMAAACQYKDAANLVYAIDYADDDKSFYIVMEYYNEGNLTRFINKNNIDNEQEIIEYFRQICYGVMILHQNNVIHRDLKPLNVFVNSYSDPTYPYKHLFVIGDLGLSRSMSFAEMSIAGTDEYMAPEVKSGSYNIKADIYSLGCILYFMFTKKAPFDKEMQKQMPTLQLDTKYPISEQSINILEKCLQYYPNNRIDNNKLFELLDLTNLYSPKFTPLPLGNASKQKGLYINSTKPKLENSKASPQENIGKPPIIVNTDVKAIPELKDQISNKEITKPEKPTNAINKDNKEDIKIKLQIPCLKIKNLRELIECINIIIGSFENNQQGQIIPILKLLNRMQDAISETPDNTSFGKYIMNCIEKSIQYKADQNKIEISILNMQDGSILDLVILAYIIHSCMETNCNAKQMHEIINLYLTKGEIADLTTQFSVNCKENMITIKLPNKL